MTLEFEIDNIAGIRKGTATIEPGVNAVQGSNWRGKSSLIAAVETVMGTTSPLTEGADHGQVSLTIGDESIVTELVRQNGQVIQRGECYLGDEQDRVCAELFAFLDEYNAIRRAVRNDENLEELLTRPLDFENIDEQIAEYQREREQVERELQRAQDAAAKLPGKQERVTKIESELEDLRGERDELGGDEDTDRDIEAKRDELSDVRADRDRVEDRIGRLEDTIDRTRQRLEDRREELEELEVPDETDLEAKLTEARDELHDIEHDIEILQSVYEANRRVLDEERLELLTEVDHGLMDDTLTCWICGSETERGEFTSRLEGLRDRIASHREEAASYHERVGELETKQETIREKRRRKRDLKDEVADLESTLTDREESLSAARDRLGELTERVDELEEQVEDADSRLTDIESEIKYKERELEEARDELDTLESRAEQRAMLEDERDELTENIEELRTRKERTKRRTREAFDDAIEDVLSRFDVGFEAARLTATFELVVAREGREASLTTLSEGERELLGIVAALAGHTAFDVNDRVPILLLDGVGGLAKNHLHTLVDYLRDRAEYLVLTAYPEHGTFDGKELDPTEWTVVADDRNLQATS